MEQKVKFILIGLIGIAGVCFFLYIQTANSKQLLVRERDDLKKENTSLLSKIDKLEDGLRDYSNKISSLNKDIDKAFREKQEIEKRYELISRERVELIEKLKAKPAEVVVVSHQQPAEPQLQLSPLAPEQDAYWAGILKSKTDLEFQLGSVRSELKSLKINNEELEREKSALELDINSLTRQKEDLSQRFEYNQKLADSVAQELVREKNDKIQINNNFKLLKNENALLLRQLKSLNSRKVDLEKKLQSLREEKTDIEYKFTEMKTNLSGKIAEVDNVKHQLEAITNMAVKKEETPVLKNSVELPPIIVRPQAEAGGEVSVSEVVGRVMAVNKDSNVAVIDLGEEKGVRAGDIFQIDRDGEPIADIEAIQVRRNITACDIKREAAPIKIGDKVR